MNFSIDQSKLAKKYNYNSLIALLLTISVFLPFYITIAVTCLVAIMAIINYQKRAETLKEPFSKFILCAVGGSFLISVVYNNQMGMLYSILIIAILLSAFYLKSIMTRQLFNSMMDMICLSSMACSIIALLQKIAVYSTNPSYRPVATFINANYYGMIIEFSVIVALYRLFTNSQNRKFYFAVIAMNMVGLYLSASMSSCIATACAALIILLFKGRYKFATVFILFAVGFVIGTLVIPQIFPRVEAIDQTLGQRLSIWSTALKGIRQHPMFGQGPSTYQMIYNEFAGYKTYHSHNLFLDTLLNYGFVGAGAIAFYSFTQIRAIVARFKNNICSNMNILLVAAGSAVIIHGLTDVTIFWVQTGLLFMILASSTGIHSAYTNRKFHPSGEIQLLPHYTSQVGAGIAYYKN